MNHSTWTTRLHPTRRRGVTLLEIVLAMGILVMVTSMTFWFYSSTLGTSREGTEAAQKLRLARTVLERMATEIRQAAGVTMDKRVGIRGEAERIWLSTYRVPSRRQAEERFNDEEPVRAEYDVNKVEYKIASHPEVLHEDGYPYPLGLARVEIMVPRPDNRKRLEVVEGEEDAVADEGQDNGRLDEEDLEAGLFPEDEEILEEGAEDSGGLGPNIDWEELYAPSIRYLRFCYYDGNQWWDDWQIEGESSLPQLVMVTLGFEIRPPFGEAVSLQESDEDELGSDGESRRDNERENSRDLTPGEINDEFCTCLNEDPVTCVALASDQLTTVVRVSQADPLFRSRVSRETQSLMEELTGGSKNEEEETER